MHLINTSDSDRSIVSFSLSNSTLLNSKVVTVTVKPNPGFLSAPVEIDFPHLRNVSYHGNQSSVCVCVCVQLNTMEEVTYDTDQTPSNQTSHARLSLSLSAGHCERDLHRLGREREVGGTLVIVCVCVCVCVCVLSQL